jgi:uncharacterized protein YpbB
MQNKERELALKFVLQTYKNVFITGKAGTGKTTLLKEILEKSDKNIAVVAPTGVAAINAKGMTIHSFFQLPSKSFIPTYDTVSGEYILNRHDLTSQQRIRKERRQVMTQLELLIIDEISMVRADLLDAIDNTLRQVRRNNELFGGVQIVVFGDLHQLSPVVNQNIWPVLSRYYATPYFFSSWAWKHSNGLKIELKKIYRQEDDSFIRILNNVRNGVMTDDDINTVNDRYHISSDRENVITLTTHNKKADVINDEELKKLASKPINLEAKVTGLFNPSAYPTDENISVKVGAQIMFLRNNIEAGYFNGKIGKVTGMVDDEIFIKCPGEELPIRITPIDWNNTAYKIDPKSNTIVQENIGTFTQYPIKLAWAVTVHKSQGLTFDQVILDLVNTFAAGQLYVALSRCASLEGITLTSKISKHSAIVDKRILNFDIENQLTENINEILEGEIDKASYLKLLSAFSFYDLLNELDEWKESLVASIIPAKGIVLKLIKSIIKDLNDIENINASFSNQLRSIFESTDIDKDEVIKERLAKAIAYISEVFYQKVVLKIDKHRKEYRVKKNTKKYIKELDPILDLAWNNLNSLYQLEFKGQSFAPSDKHERVKLFDPDNYGKDKAEKTPSYLITYGLFERGFNMEEIAKERTMSESTIETHMAKLVSESKVDITEILPSPLIKKIKKVIEKDPEGTLTEYIKSLPQEVTYGQLRIVQAEMRKES